MMIMMVILIQMIKVYKNQTQASSKMSIVEEFTSSIIKFNELEGFKIFSVTIIHRYIS